MIIKSYEQQDLETVLELFYQTVHFVNAKDYTQEQLEVWAPEQADKQSWQQKLTHNYTLLAWQDKELVGFASLAQKSCIDLLYIQKDKQSMGLAKKLLFALERYASQNNSPQLCVFASLTALPFFEKSGYSLIRENLVHRHGQTLKNYLLIKALT